MAISRNSSLLHRVLRVASCLTLSLALLLGVAMVVESVGVEATEAVAPFVLKDINGKTFDSSKQLIGKVSVLSFWRLEQQYSMKLLMDLAKLDKEMGPAAPNIVTIVSGDTNVAEIKKIVADYGIKFPVLLDPERSVYGAFGVRVSPSTWFLDKKGQQQFEYMGYRRDFGTVLKADSEFLLGKISESERKDRTTQRKAPPSTEKAGTTVRFRLAQRLLDQGKVEQAKTTLREAWEGEPPVVAAGVELGMLLLKEDKVSEALELLDKVTAAAPDNARAMGAKGLALVKSGRGQEGEKLLAKALEANVNEPLFYYEMALYRESSGAKDEACGYYKRGLKLLMEPPSAKSSVSAAAAAAKAKKEAAAKK